MLPHPSTIHAVADLRRSDLLGAAERERRAARAHDRTATTVRTRAVGPLIASIVVILVVIGLATPPGALSNQARASSVAALSAEEAANLEVAHRFFQELHDTGNLAVAQEIIAPDAIFHIPGAELTGPEGISGLVTMLRTAFPDAVFPMEDVVVAGDTVAVRWTMRGTSQGEFHGIPPTGQPVELRGSAFLTIANGQIVEDWMIYDQLGLLEQLGAAPEADADRTCVARSKVESSCQ